MSNIIKTCIAFANGYGGEIIIGVEDQTRKIVGATLLDSERCYEALPDAVYDSVSPFLIPEIYEKNINDKHIIIVKIHPGNKKPYFIKKEGLPKGIYIRVGSHTRRATEEYVEELIKKQRKIDYDEEIIECDKEIILVSNDLKLSATPRDVLFSAVRDVLWLAVGRRVPMSAFCL